MPELLENRVLLSNSYQVTLASDNPTTPDQYSLRWAINQVNGDMSDDGSGGPDTITFAIPGAGMQMIALQSELPPISRPVIIEGITQTGYGARR